MLVLGFRDKGLGFGVQRSGDLARDSSIVLGEALGGVQGCEALFRVSGLDFTVSGFGFRVNKGLDLALDSRIVLGEALGGVRLDVPRRHLGQELVRVLHRLLFKRNKSNRQDQTQDHVAAPSLSATCPCPSPPVILRQQVEPSGPNPARRLTITCQRLSASCSCAVSATLAVPRHEDQTHAKDVTESPAELLKDVVSCVHVVWVV
eukprot:3445246-Rhodomonas_salina.1